MSLEKIAVCGLIKRPNGKVLGVSRKDNKEDFGLPGGKVDPGETPADALYREILEETGYTIKKHNWVFTSVEADGYYCLTFLCEVDETTKVSVSEKETGVIKDVTWDELKSGCFKSYNTKLYDDLLKRGFFEGLLKD